MSLLEELDAELEARKRGHWKITDLLKSLDDEERPEVEKALTERLGSKYKYSAPILATALRRKGHDISASSIRNYRNETS